MSAIIKSVSFLLICLLNNLNIYAQDDESIVAKIGNDNISVKDFKLRIELSPYIPTKSKIDRLSANQFKSDFLYSLIAEKLWAKEAERLGFLTSEIFDFHFKPLEDLFVRDALFKREVEDKVKLSADDVNNAIRRSQFKFQVQIISSTDSIRIFTFFNELNETSNFDSLFSDFNNLDSTEAEVTFGSLKNEAIEDSVYNLELNRFSYPLKTEIGWITLRTLNRIFTPIDLSNQVVVNKAKKAMRERRVENRYHQYISDLLIGIKVEINQESFLLFADKIWNALKIKYSNIDSISYFSLNEWDFRALLTSYSKDQINKSLFTLEKSQITIKDFLGDLAFNGFSVNNLDSLIVLNRLNKRVKQFVENQIITQEGYKRKLQLAPDVSKDLAMWKQKYLAELFFKASLDSTTVSEVEIYDHYINELTNKKDVPLFNLRILTLSELDEIVKIFDLLKGDNSFAELIVKYGKTDPLVNEYGETGLKPAALLGDLGKIAATLKLNDVYGPIRRNNTYSIIQVFDKVEGKDSLKFKFDSIKDELRNSLQFKKFSENLVKTTADFAEKYGVKIYNKILNKTEITEIPMFLHRFMGFGGRIAGVPLLTPFSDWIDNATLKKVLLP